MVRKLISNLNTRFMQRAASSRRHTVVAGRKGSVHADFLESANNSLDVVAKADASNPLILSTAMGFHGDGAPKDGFQKITSDQTFTGLVANAMNFLGFKRNSQTSYSKVVTQLPPVYGNIFSSDRENKINASFNGTHGDTEFVDEYGNHFRAYGTGWQISNANQYSGMNTARCNSIAAGNRWECIPANLDNRSLDQWTIECFYRVDSFATPQVIFSAFTSESAYATGLQYLIDTTGQPALYLSNNESGYNILGGGPSISMNAIATRPPIMGLGDIAATNAGHTAGQWYHMAWSFNGLKHMMFVNGYLIRIVETIGMSEVFDYLKPAKFGKIWLGNNPPNNPLIGNISNFAFHPYAKYTTKKVAVAGDTPAVRDIFIPPTVPLSLTLQSDRYYQESEAIYLDFESAADGDITTKDLYGRQLSAVGNNSVTLTTGSYIESGAAKFGTKSLYFSGTASQVNAAYIKAPVWADKWTVEFWAMDNLLTAPNKTAICLVVPGINQGWGFQVSSDGNGSKIRFSINLDSDDQSSSDILQFNSSYSYDAAVWNHVAVSYDGVTYRFFINGSLLASAVSQLKVVNGSHFVFGRHAANLYHRDGRIDDFAYVPYCKYTASFTPPATALLASMPEQYVFDIKKMQMYKGYPTSFVADNSLFLGEALTSATNVEQIITYALNGEYHERFSTDMLTASSFLFTKRHDIGTNRIFGKLYAINLQGAMIYKEMLEIMTFDTAPYLIPPLGIADRKLYVLHKGSSGYAIIASNGSAQQINSATTHYVDFYVILSRSF